MSLSFLRCKLSWLIPLFWIFLAACSPSFPPESSTPATLPSTAQALETLDIVTPELTPSRLPEPSMAAATASDPVPLEPGDDSAVFSEEAPTPASDHLDTPVRNMISARLDYDQHHLQVRQTIEVVNHAAGPLSELLLVVEPNRQPGVFRLQEIVGHDGVVLENFNLDGARLTIPLLTDLLPGSTVSLSLKYDLFLPEENGPFGYTSQQTNLGDWYAFVPPYHAEHGWLVHEPGAVGEHLVYGPQDFEVKLELIGRTDDLVVAASALPETNSNPYRYHLQSARNFSLSLSPDYQVSRVQAGPVTVLSYFFPETSLSADVALRATVDALNVYSDIFQPYPFDSLSVVQADFKDGMEYSGLYFLDQNLYINYNGTQRSYLIAIAAHETAHQWWYGIVANDQTLEPWLDETFATYSELLFYERIYPEHISWWWQIRVLHYDPAGFVDTTIYEHDNFRSYVDAVYLRGALFLQEIRDLVGDEAFMDLLREFQQVEEHTLITAEDFWELLLRQSGEEVKQIRKEYFLQ